MLEQLPEWREGRRWGGQATVWPGNKKDWAAATCTVPNRRSGDLARPYVLRAPWELQPRCPPASFPTGGFLVTGELD